LGLPVAASADAWDALLADDSALAAGVAAIAARHGLHGATVRRYDAGSMPVYALGARDVLKLFPPHAASHASVEAQVLVFVAGKLPMAAPEVTATGALDGWRYILMTQLRGVRWSTRGRRCLWPNATGLATSSTSSPPWWASPTMNLHRWVCSSRAAMRACCAVR
jgi:hypothetical protein